MIIPYGFNISHFFTKVNNIKSCSQANRALLQNMKRAVPVGTALSYLKRCVEYISVPEVQGTMKRFVDLCKAVLCLLL